MVKNRKLAKSISDASWSMFREWLEYFAKVFNKVVVAVPPHYTSQNCSNCGTVVKKSLSVRTHCCPACKTVLDRDENAAINILMKALEILGNTAGHAEINAHGQFDLCLVGEPKGKEMRIPRLLSGGVSMFNVWFWWLLAILL
jgi:putative transposase